MPLYEYRCSSCGECVEVLQRVGDPPLTECLRCGGAMEKLLSAPALQFRGSGWYITDYARKGNGSSATGEDTPKAAGEAAKPASGEAAKSAPADAAPATPSPATAPAT